MSAAEGHWLDRFAERQSRRQLLKTALAGAVLTLPFAPSAAARSGDDCETGCLYTVRARGDRAYLSCEEPVNACFRGLYSALTWSVYTNGQSFQLANQSCLKAFGAQAASCFDRALLQEKAANWDCLQPGCSGFDPAGPDGPCEEWAKQGLQCCPDPSSPVGYCPAKAPASCCDPSGKGCASGVAVCGFGA